MADILIHLSDPAVGAEAFHAATLHVAGQPMLVVDTDGWIRFANRGAAAALGYHGADELVGRHGCETLHRRGPGPFRHAASECPLLPGRATGTTLSSDLDWLVRRDGSLLRVSYVRVPLDTPNGPSAVVAFTDAEAEPGTGRGRFERATAADEEQAALRRLAALAAAGAPARDVAAAVAREVARLMRVPIAAVGRYDDGGAAVTIVGAWNGGPQLFRPGTRWPVAGASLAERVLETGRAAMVENYADVTGAIGEAARRAGVRAGVGAPLVADGELWGFVAAAAEQGAALPPDAERRLTQFAALVAGVIWNGQAREDLHRLAAEQAALRRVATLFAERATPAEVFAAVAREVAAVLKLPLSAIFRYEPDGTATVVGASGEHPFQPGTTWTPDGPTLMSVVRDTGRAARVEDYAALSGTLARTAAAAGLKGGVGAPIVVDSALWGVICVCSDERRQLPADAESRVSQFTALVATAIANTQARQDLRRVAQEHAGLRRVATLVAEAATPAKVFDAVAREVGRVLRLPLVAMFRYEPDGTATGVGSLGEHPFQPGTNWPLDGTSVAGVVRRTGRHTRIEDYAAVTGTIGEASLSAGFQDGVGAPIVVDGELWGVVCGAADRRQPLPADAERRLSAFTALVATAISNTQAREDLSRLVNEHAALRRLATLVAQGAEPHVVFDAVCEETGLVLGASAVTLSHVTAEGANVRMAGWAAAGAEPARAEGVDAIVRDGAVPARGESTSQVGAPVIVEGRIWGTLVAAAADGRRALAAGTEHRLASFAELIATAVSNAAAREELVDSRVRIVEAADEQRRRVARDLHDGAQSRLIHAVIALERVPVDARPAVSEGLAHVHSAIAELRELARGIHPATLTNHGLAAAIEALADRTPLPVQIEIADERYSTAVESAAYFVAAEALTNVAKYARASAARVSLSRTPAGLRLTVEDDGVGGAARMPGGGLAGLGDRLAALDGVLAIESAPGTGTRIRADIPLPAPE